MILGEKVHLSPAVGEGLTPCCRRAPFELPGTDRLTKDPDAVTCQPMPTSRRSMQFSRRDLRDALGLPDDVTVVGYRVDRDPARIVVEVESERFGKLDGTAWISLEQARGAANGGR
jgi:hypothetical protein